MEEAHSKEHVDTGGGDGVEYRWLIGPVIGSFLGNALLLAVGCLLAVVWQLFEEFREPLLWGLWCSVALRGAKEYLVGWLEEFLRVRFVASSRVLLHSPDSSLHSTDRLAVDGDWDREGPSSQIRIVEWPLNVHQYSTPNPCSPITATYFL
jgi:hypothetical protein